MLTGMGAVLSGLMVSDPYHTCVEPYTCQAEKRIFENLLRKIGYKSVVIGLQTANCLPANRVTIG